MSRRRRRALLACACAAAAAVLSGLVLVAPASALSPPRLSVRAAILVSPRTGQRLFGVAADKPTAIASTTKLMTALVTLEHTRLGQMFADPNYHPGAEDSQIGLVPGERMSVHDLMLAMLLPSADDAAEDLAFNVGHGSVDRFVVMMNARARELGLRHTHYSTPIGLDTPGNYSTPADLIKLAAYDLDHQPFFAHAVGQAHAVLHTGSYVRVIDNRNDLVGRIPWIHGVKTGHTLDAGYVLVAAARRDGVTLLSAVLGTTSEAARDQNTLSLLNWGFENFHLLTPVRQGQVVARLPVRDQPGKRAVVLVESGFSRLFARDQHVRVRTTLPRQLSGPLRRHAVVGTAEVLVDGRPVKRVRLILAEPLAAVSSLTVAARFITRASTLLPLVVALAALCLLLFVVRLRRRQAEQGRGAN